MDRLEEVASLICEDAGDTWDLTPDEYKESYNKLAKQICSLFPKPDEKSCPNEQCKHNAWNSKECYDCGWTEAISDIASREATTKPDESGWLSDDEVLDMWTKNKEDCGMVTDFARKIMSKTASIVRDKTLKEVESIGEVMNINSRDELVIVYRDWKRLKKGG